GDAISVRSPSIITRASRWMKQNTRLVYTAFTIIAGMGITLPFAMLILLGPGGYHQDVYSRFPADQTPWIFSFQSSIPFGVSIGALILLVLVFYPTIGYINAIVTSARSLRHSVFNGAITATILGVLFAVVIGWIPLAGELADESSAVIRKLGNVVWTPEGVSSEQALDKANALFEGLDQIPVEERAELVAQRVTLDQFYQAVRAILKLLLVFVMLSLPIVVGTALAHIIMRRGHRWWFAYIRYYVAWWLTMTLCFFTFGFVLTGARVNGRPLSEQRWLAVRVVGTSAVLLFLVMRRWKRKSSVAESPTTSMVDPTLPLQTN
ncbi:MAG: hypothetical protein AAF497_28960, partial [Planctomycetota bacterium]